MPEPSGGSGLNPSFSCGELWCTDFVTGGKDRRFRRASGDDYVVHYQDLTPEQVGWWQEIPTVTPATAIEQCLVYGTPTYLLRQAIARGYEQGYLKTAERDSGNRLAGGAKHHNRIGRHVSMGNRILHPRAIPGLDTAAGHTDGGEPCLNEAIHIARRSGTNTPGHCPTRTTAS